MNYEITSHCFRLHHCGSRAGDRRYVGICPFLAMYIHLNLHSNCDDYFGFYFYSDYKCNFMSSVGLYKFLKQNFSLFEHTTELYFGIIFFSRIVPGA